MSTFGPDLTDPFVAAQWCCARPSHTDAAQRDKAGGRPTAQIRLLKESGLLAAGIPAAPAAAARFVLSLLRVVREFARTDGSLAHLLRPPPPPRAYRAGAWARLTRKNGCCAPAARAAMAVEQLWQCTVEDLRRPARARRRWLDSHRLPATSPAARMWPT
ncbi:hypothetical protein ACU4GD_30715 [Cupriavidus basilensis]